MTELVEWVGRERKTARLHPLLIIALVVVEAGANVWPRPYNFGNGAEQKMEVKFESLSAK